MQVHFFAIIRTISATLLLFIFTTTSTLCSADIPYDTDAWGNWREWTPCTSMECMKGTRSRVMICQNDAGAYSTHGCQDDGETEMRMAKFDTASCPICDKPESKQGESQMKAMSELHF